jgi:hypothetical protein
MPLVSQHDVTFIGSSESVGNDNSIRTRRAVERTVPNVVAAIWIGRVGARARLVDDSKQTDTAFGTKDSRTLTLDRETSSG